MMPCTSGSSFAWYSASSRSYSCTVRSSNRIPSASHALPVHSAYLRAAGSCESSPPVVVHEAFRVRTRRITSYQAAGPTATYRIGKERHQLGSHSSILIGNSVANVLTVRLRHIRHVDLDGGWKARLIHRGGHIRLKAFSCEAEMTQGKIYHCVERSRQPTALDTQRNGGRKSWNVCSSSAFNANRRGNSAILCEVCNGKKRLYLTAFSYPSKAQPPARAALMAARLLSAIATVSQPGWRPPEHLGDETKTA